MGFSDLCRVCLYVFKFWNMTSSSYAIHVSGSLNCFAKGKQNWLCFYIPFTAKLTEMYKGRRRKDRAPATSI